MTKNKRKVTAQQYEESKNRLLDLCKRASKDEVGKIRIYGLVKHRGDSHANGPIRVLDVFLIVDGSLERISHIASIVGDLNYSHKYEGIRLMGGGYNALDSIVETIQGRLFGGNSISHFYREMISSGK